MDHLLEITDMECPLCGNAKDVEKRKRTGRALFGKGEVVLYEEYYIHCPCCVADFIPAKVMDENLARARAARKHQMLIRNK